MRKPKGVKTDKELIRNYLINHGQISIKTAKAFGWNRLVANICDYRKDGMKIRTSFQNGETVYILEQDGLHIEEYPSYKKEIEIKPEDMHIKTSMKEVILDHLKKHKTITSALAMKKYKCLNIYSVISRLREEGWNITRSSSRENNDFNVASNRNNAYTVYKLENKTREKTVYKTTYVCQLVVEKSIPEMVDTHESKIKAMGELNRVTDLMVQDLNLFYGNSLVEFIKVVDTDSIMVVKKETVKKLFSKKYNTTMLAKFTIYEQTVEI